MFQYLFSLHHNYFLNIWNFSNNIHHNFILDWIYFRTLYRIISIRLLKLLRSFECSVITIFLVAFYHFLKINMKIITELDFCLSLNKYWFKTIFPRIVWHFALSIFKIKKKPQFCNAKIAYSKYFIKNKKINTHFIVTNSKNNYNSFFFFY